MQSTLSTLKEKFHYGSDEQWELGMDKVKSRKFLDNIYHNIGLIVIVIIIFAVDDEFGKFYNSLCDSSMKISNYNTELQT